MFTRGTPAGAGGARTRLSVVSRKVGSRMLEDFEDAEDETIEYFQFTGRQRLETAMHTLRGFVEGLVADARVNDLEVQ